MTSDATTPPTKRLILFAQDKGGIGKSFVATLLYDYLVERAVRGQVDEEDVLVSVHHRRHALNGALQVQRRGPWQLGRAALPMHPGS